MGVTTATKSYTHLTRFFGEPLMVSRSKLETLVSAMSGRLGCEPLVEVAELSREERNELALERKATTADGIRILSLRGTLLKRARGMNALSGLTGYEALSVDLAEALADDNVRGIVLDVDSPGGEAQSSFELADEILAAREIKPVFAVANANAHSAAYLLASHAERVYVERTSSVGSIGVYTVHVDQSRANEAAGVKPTFIFAGARKVDGNAHEPLSAEVRERLQARVDRSYGFFVEAVAKARGLTAKAVKDTEADTYEGQEAIDAGLATHAGGLETAIKHMREELEVSEEHMKQVASLQGTITEQAARLQVLEGVNAEQQATITRLQEQAAAHASEKLESYVRSIEDRCDAAGVLPPGPDKLEEVREALALSEKIGKRLGEAMLANCLAVATGSTTGGPTTTKKLDESDTAAAARKAFAAGVPLKAHPKKEA